MLHPDRGESTKGWAIYPACVIHISLLIRKSEIRRKWWVVVVLIILILTIGATSIYIEKRQSLLNL